MKLSSDLKPKSIIKPCGDRSIVHMAIICYIKMRIKLTNVRIIITQYYHAYNRALI